MSWKLPDKYCPRCGNLLWELKIAEPSFYERIYVCKKCGYTKFIEKMWRF